MSCLDGRKWHSVHSRLWVKPSALTPIIIRKAVGGEHRLYRQALPKNHVMCGELDMIVLDHIKSVRVACDNVAAIRQITDRE